MSDMNDPRRPIRTRYLKQRIKGTKVQLKELEVQLFRHIEETNRASYTMSDFIKHFIAYGTDEDNETGSLLRAMARILKTANSHENHRIAMLVRVGENLRHVKSIYREARATLAEYYNTRDKLTWAKRKSKTIESSCIVRSKAARKARESFARVESELLRRKTILDIEIENFDGNLRAALTKFFLQFAKCEMITAARLLETYSESTKKLEKWTKTSLEKTPDCK
eukprot:gene12028-13270_t